jgi:threonine-phosphate decarboxylase
MAQPESYPLHGGQLRQIAERFSVEASQLLDFSANINPEGPPSTVIPALHTSLSDLRNLTDYPDLQQPVLKRAIAVYAGVTPQNIIIANGFVPLLEATLKTLSIRSCRLPVPAFIEYRKTLERANVTVVLHPLHAEDRFHYDAASLTSPQCDALLLANPQNPSGVGHDSTRMRQIVTEAARHNTFVLLDEAFIDYVPHHSLTRATEEHPNLIVFRSVTKFHAIPGLRVAYAIANPTLASSISENLPPWPVTTLASQAAIAALSDQPYIERSIRENDDRRAALQHSLQSLGLTVYPSAANFLLFALPVGIDPDTFWEEMIVDHNIVLRNCANYEGLPPGHFRVAVKTPEENTKLEQALRNVLFSRRL